MAEFVVTQTENGGRVSASAGDFIVIRLSENPTTGYRWHVDTAGSLRLVEDGFTAASGALGAGGERVFRFAAMAPGISMVEVTLRRSWEVGTAAQAQFRVMVEVK